jgi:beta-glucosidase
MPRVTGQLPMTYAHRPTGRPADPDLTIDSARYHDVAIGPLFPFGHGLAYTRFTYGDLLLSAASIRPGEALRVTIPVTNSGARAGEEVVQLYVRDPIASVERPVKELRGFVRLSLDPGQTRRVTFTLAPEQLAFWQAGKWIVEPGRIELMVGSSSEDIRATGHFDITGAGQGKVPAASVATRVSIA